MKRLSTLSIAGLAIGLPVAAKERRNHMFYNIFHKRSLITGLLLAAAFVAGIMAAPTASFAGVSLGVAVTIAPPALPVYVQPLNPGPGYIWTPGYWAWDPDIGYYWVPGTWVLPPAIGLLWTPGYWSWNHGYFWIDGYWGPVVGFYGGINYGFGYPGFGYFGGYWRGNTFYYNRTVNNVNVTNITNVYSQSVSSIRPSGASFNGGSGGTTARPTSAQLAAASQRSFSPTSAQVRQMSVARADPKQRVTVNNGLPAVAATAKPGVFTGSGAIKASRTETASRTSSGSVLAPSGASTRTPRAGEAGRHQSVNAPPKQAPMERSAAPRNEPVQRAYRQNELRSAPERGGSSYAAPQRPAETRQQNFSHAAPQRQEIHNQRQDGHVDNKEAR